MTLKYINFIIKVVDIFKFYNLSISEESLMQKCNISLQIFLNFFVNPSFEVNKIKSMWELYFLLLKPL